jgi:hypothetical protein
MSVQEDVCTPLVDCGAKGISPGLRLHRVPLVWVAVGVPAAFVFWLFFLAPSL